MKAVPNSWAVVPIVDVLMRNANGKPFQQGWSPQCKSYPASEDQWGVLKTTAIQPGVFWDHENKELPDDLEARPHIEIQAGDLLMTCAGPRSRCGVVCLVERTRPRLMMSGKMYRFRSNPEVMNSRFLAYFIQSRSAQVAIDGMKTGISDSGLNLTHDRFATLAVPVAPLNEQRRIVAKIEELFSELDKGVESLNTAREQLKAYRQSVLKAAFDSRLTQDWRKKNVGVLESGSALAVHIIKERERRYENDFAEWRKLVRVAETEGLPKPRKPSRPTTADKPSPQQARLMCELPPSWTWLQLGNFAFVTKLAGFEYTKHVHYDPEGDLEVIKAENAGPNGFRETNFSKVRSDSVASLERSQLRGGELLMVFVGAGTGNVATVPAGRSFFLGPNIGMMRITSSRVIPLFVEYFLRSPLGRELALSSVKAVAQPSLSMGTIRQIPVALPSPAEQAEIVRLLVSKLESTDALDTEIEAGLARANALRQSILKRAFSGGLVAQDPADEPASLLLERIRSEREGTGITKRRNNKNSKKEAA